MIDFETEIFNEVYPSVAPLCAKNAFRSIHTPFPAAFPACSLFEIGNATDRPRKSTAAEEDYAVLSYEAHAYDNTKEGCRKVFAALDNKMIQLGFLRMSGAPIQNQKDTQVFELIGRYQAEIDQNGQIFRRR